MVCRCAREIFEPVCDCSLFFELLLLSLLCPLGNRNAVNIVQKKTIYLPYAARDLMGNVVSNIPSVFGRNATGGGGDKNGMRKRASAGTKSDVGAKQSGGAKNFNALD